MAHTARFSATSTETAGCGSPDRLTVASVDDSDVEECGPQDGMLTKRWKEEDKSDHARE